MAVNANAFCVDVMYGWWRVMWAILNVPLP